MCTYLFTSESDTKDRREELGLFCYYKALALPRKRYVIWKKTWIRGICTLQTLEWPLKKSKKKKRSITDILKKERKYII